MKKIRNERFIMNSRKDFNDGFTGRIGFTLASVGSAVGMGNIWRFPLMVSLWSGLSFLIPYFIFVILIANTGMIEEFSLGRLTGSGPVSAFSYATSKKGNEKIGKRLGLIPVLGSLALAIGYTAVMGWIFKYNYLAINGSLSNLSNNMEDIVGTFSSIAASFANNPAIIIAGITSMIIMSFGIAKGIERANKILMPILFLLLLGLAIYIAFNPEAARGYKYIFNVDINKLTDIKLWIFAFGQAFFSLSIAGNGSVIYGSYLPKNEDIPASARNIAFFDTLAALLASFVIIPAMAVGGADLTEGGPGLMFIYLVNVFNKMEAGKILMIIFYLAVLFAGISSIINLYEAPVAFLQERFAFSRKKSAFLINLLGIAVAILIQGIVGPWMDFVSIIIAPLGAFLAGIMFFWILDKDQALAEVNKGCKKTRGSSFIVLGKYIYCPLSLLALILGIIFGGIG